MRRPWLTTALFALLAIAGAVGTSRLRETDDVLDFLPPGDPDIRVFNDVNAKFGALRVALIGVEAPQGDDVFAPDTLVRLGRATEALKALRGVDRVVSLSSLVDFVPAEGSVQVVPLIESPPATAAERAALKARVMSRMHIVGSFVSRDARAALLLVFLAPPQPGEDVPLRQVAHRLRQAAQSAVAGSALTLFYGGAPFAAATIFEETQDDIRHLTPLAMLFILAVIVIAFRDPVGVVLTVVTVGWAVLVVLGVMGFLGEPYTVVSSTLPVILFASGSSYAVHLLGRYYALGGKTNGVNALLEAAQVVTPPVTIAGFTTASGFFSFVVMDIRPMRTFGLECAAGVLLCLGAALWLVPAVVTLWPRRASSPAQMGRIGELLAQCGSWAFRARTFLFATSAFVALATIWPMLQVEVRMEPSSFFRRGSEPWLAEQFLDERFGGSHFLQVAVAGDLTDPATLREVKRLCEFARAQAGVTQVSSVIEPLELVSDAMGLGHHLPETRGQTTNLLFFIEGEPSLRSLLRAERDEALIHIRIRGDAQPAMIAIEQYLAHTFQTRPQAPTERVVAERVRWIIDAAQVAITPAEQRALLGRLAAFAQHSDAAPLQEARYRAALSVLRGDGGVMSPLAPHDPARSEQIARLAAAKATAAQAKAELLSALAPSEPDPEARAVIWDGLVERMQDVERQARVEHALEPLAARVPAAVLQELGDTLLDLLPLNPLPPASQSLVARVAGEPVLDRGLSRSVGKNQTRSLVVSLVAVLGFMFLLFRTPRLALLSVYPSALTMAVVFGIMGMAGVRIDIGTSLVASIATGAGSDFAMHYLWYLRRSSHEDVVRFVGPIMVISTLLVALGFAVLGLGKAQPMRLFGFLAAIAMALAAGLTFLLVPALVGEPASDSSVPAPAQEEKST